MWELGGEVWAFCVVHCGEQIYLWESPFLKIWKEDLGMKFPLIYLQSPSAEEVGNLIVHPWKEF